MNLQNETNSERRNEEIKLKTNKTQETRRTSHNMYSKLRFTKQTYKYTTTINNTTK